MGDAGTALMGVGTGIGKTRAQDAAVAAISSPLLDFPIKRAKGIVFNVVGGFDLTLAEVRRDEGWSEATAACHRPLTTNNFPLVASLLAPPRLPRSTQQQKLFTRTPTQTPT